MQGSDKGRPELGLVMNLEMAPHLQKSLSNAKRRSAPPALGLTRVLALAQTLDPLYLPFTSLLFSNSYSVHVCLIPRTVRSADLAASCSRFKSRREPSLRISTNQTVLSPAERQHICRRRSIQHCFTAVMANIDAQPTMAKVHHGDAYATKVVDKTNHLQEKAGQKKAHAQGHGADVAKKAKGPAGGFDSTPVLQNEPGYTIKFTFHRAAGLPFADINSLSSDPYLLVQLNTGLPTRKKQDPYMRYRSPTIRRNTEPEWNCDWVVANVPATGFTAKIRIYDEDPADHDDRLGDVHIRVDRLSEEWSGFREQTFDVKKRKGSKRAYMMRGCAAMFSRAVSMSGALVVSAQVLGRTEPESKGRVYTVGPCNWSRHFSPLIGRLAGTKNPANQDSGEKGTETYK